MDKKEIAKKYLIMVLSLLIACVLLSALLVFAISHSSIETISLTNLQKTLLILAAGYVPSASFTGFYACFLNIKSFNRFLKIALVLFFPITLIIITIVGIVMVIPSIIKAIVVLLNSPK